MILHVAAHHFTTPALEELIRAGLTGLDIEEKFQGSTALELMRRRTEVCPEWLSTFEALLRSINRVDTASHDTTLNDRNRVRGENGGSQDNRGDRRTSDSQADQDEDGNEIFINTVEYH